MPDTSQTQAQQAATATEDPEQSTTEKEAGSDSSCQTPAKKKGGKGKAAIKNKRDGLAREQQTEAELEQKYGKEAVQPEQYLRSKDGKIAKDPLSGEARRIDHVVIKDGKALDAVETTSLTADKTAQVAKEGAIRKAGGTFVRDRCTRQLVDLSQTPTRLVRRP